MFSAEYKLCNIIAPKQCSYRSCVNTNNTKALFALPIDDEHRLKLWIKNSGNNTFKSLQRHELSQRFICEDHFDAKDVVKNDLRTKLISNIVPLSTDLVPIPYNVKPTTGYMVCQYINCQSTSRTHSLFRFPKDPKRLRKWIDNSGNKDLKNTPLEIIYHRYICEDHFHRKDKHFKEERTRLVRRAVPKPYNVQIEDDDDVPVFKESQWQGIYMYGFQWWCLQCGGPSCSSCIVRMGHRPHFVLRLPAQTTPERVGIVIAAIQKELQLKDFFMIPEVKLDLDQGETADEDMDQIKQVLKEEPLVKLEPPDETDDPLAGCFLNQSINYQLNETPAVNCSFFPEHDPNKQSNLSLNSGLESSSRLKNSQQSPGLEDSIDLPTANSLGIVKPLQGPKKNYSRTNNTGNKLIQSVGLEIPIDFDPNISGRVDCKPKQKSSGLATSINYEPTEMPFGLGISFESQPEESSPSDFDGPSLPRVEQTKAVPQPSNDRIRVLSCPIEVEIDSKPIKEELNDKTPQINTKQHPAGRISKNKRKLTETKQKIHNKKQKTNFQVYTAHRKQSKMTIKQEDDQNKQTKSSEPDIKEEPRIFVYSTHVKKRSKDTEISLKEEDHCNQNVNSKDTNNDLQIKSQNPVNISHEDSNSTENAEQDQNNTLQKDQTFMEDDTKRNDNKIKSNTAEHTKSENKILEPELVVFSTHKKQKHNETADQKETKVSDNNTQTLQLETNEHDNVPKIQQPIRCTETSEQDKEKQKFQVFSTHKARKPKI